MHDTERQHATGLAGLAIDRSRRPTTSVRSRRTLIFVCLAVFAIAVAAAWWYYRTTGVNIVQAMSEQPVEVNLLIVEPAAADSPAVVLVATGKIISDLQVKVATKVSGQIVELNVEQGDSVEKDQVLARVEDATYRSQRDEAAAQVERQKSELARVRSEQTRADAALVQAQAEYEFEKRNYERLQRLRDNGQAGDFEFYNSKNLFEAAQAGLDVARASIQTAAAAVAVAQSELTAAEAFLGLTQKRLDDCAIRAPISGVVLERNAQIGDFLAAEGGRGANANAQLVEIADMTRLRVEIDVSEKDVHRIFADQSAGITPDADPSTAYQGRVMWIDPIGDYAKATVQVKVRVLDPGPNLRIEGSAKVEFRSAASSAGEVASRSTPTYWIPKSAVRLTPGSDEAVVFTAAEDRAVAHRIRLGTRTDKRVEVLSGLSAGMQLMAGDLEQLNDGRSVRIGKTLKNDEL